MKYILAVLAVALYLPVVADGQTPTVAPGARIRVTAPSRDLERHVTTVLEVRDDSVVVGASGNSRALELASITALDISAGTRRQTAKGAMLGLAIGVVTGALIGAASYEECVPESFLDCFGASGSREEEATLGAALFGGAGLVIGAIVGTLNRTDRWTAVNIPVQLAVAPTRAGGLGVALQRSF